MGRLKNPKYPLMLGVINVKRSAKWCAQFWRKVKPSKVLIQESGGQCVGKSETQFKKRHSNHKQEIKNKVGGLGHHYGGSGGCGYTNISIIIIEEVETKTKAYLAEREVFWQHQLRVYVENGSNGHCYRKEV